ALPISFPGKKDIRQGGNAQSGRLAVSGVPVKRKNPLTTDVNGSQESGRLDSNQRPHGPEPCALAKLSYAPWFVYRNCRLEIVNGSDPKRPGAVICPILCILANFVPRRAGSFQAVWQCGKDRHFLRWASLTG